MSVSQNNSRPQILTWLCIGSFVTGIAWIIMFLAIILFSIQENIPAKLFPGIALDYLHTGYWFIILEIILAGLGLKAVYMMWNLRKPGFYIYLLIKTLTYFLPVVFIGSHHLTFPGLVLTSVMIVLYGMNILKLPKSNKI